MSKDAIAGRLVAELSAAATREAPGAELVSVELNFIDAGDVAEIRTKVERRTRTLAFVTADAFDQNDARIASGSSVHKIV